MYKIYIYTNVFFSKHRGSGGRYEQHGLLKDLLMYFPHKNCYNVLVVIMSSTGLYVFASRS